MILIPAKAKPIKDFFDSFNEVVLKIIDIIMMFAPYGVFALLAALIVEAPNPDLLMSLHVLNNIIIRLNINDHYLRYDCKINNWKKPNFISKRNFTVSCIFYKLKCSDSSYNNG